MAWVRYRQQYPDDALLPEMDKDVRRLQMIAERFKDWLTELTPEDINALIERAGLYAMSHVG